MSKEIINTNNAPAALGPYSQGIKAGGLVFVSGQIPIDPTTGIMVEDNIKNAARQVIENVRAVLEAAGTDISRVVKTTVYMRDLKSFAEMNEVYAEYFMESLPARACVEVSALPKNALIEIEVIAEG